MNIVNIKINQFYDPEYAEYFFVTYLGRHEIIDFNGNMTSEFVSWVKQKHKEIYDAYENNPEYFEISYIDNRDCEPIDNLNGR